MGSSNLFSRSSLSLWLFAVAGALLALEVVGVPMRGHVHLHGDVTREARFLAQYGQFLCVVIAAALIWRLDPVRRRGVLVLIVSAVATVIAAELLKHMTGRARPDFGSPGEFTGPFIHQLPKRESFPSAHTASAFAVSCILSRLYPKAGVVVWPLAIACGALRWIENAHWLSDVAGGAAVGYAVAALTWQVLWRAPTQERLPLAEPAAVAPE